MCISFIIFNKSPIEGYKTSDPLGTLLVSQSILERGTVILDDYPKDILDSFEWQIYRRNGHTYYSYPLGTSVFMIPFVVLANLTHMDMKIRHHEIILQGRLAALSATFALLLIYLLARCYFMPVISVFLTIILTFGSAISSTLALALWNMNLSVLFLLWSLLLLVKDKMGKKKLNPYLLGFLLFSAFFCRPTTAIFIFSVMIYLLVKNRSAFLKVASIAFPCLIALLLFSLKVYHSVYPGNYDFTFSDYGHTGFNWMAFYGHLFSPSRGLFVLSPFLILSFVGIIIFFKKIYKNLFFWILLMGFILHLYLVSTWKMWWGGGGFGYRLLTDSYPYLVLITIIIFQCFLTVKTRYRRWGLISVFALLGVFSLYVHSYQGLYNINTDRWNHRLKPEGNEEYLFSWAHPQFLAKLGDFEPQILAKPEDFEPQILAKPEDFELKKINRIYNLGDEILPESETALFDGWYSIERSSYGNFRWSSGKQARIWLNMRINDLPNIPLALELTVGTFWTQTVEVLVNGHRVGTIKTVKNSNPIEYTFAFKIKLSKGTDLDQFLKLSIEFSIPGARSPAQVEKTRSKDLRTLGIRFFKLKLRKK